MTEAELEEFNQRPKGCPDYIDAFMWNGPDNRWPDDQPFPLTAEECLWLMKGAAVLPASGPLTVDVFYWLQYRKWELIDGRVSPR